MAGVKGRSGGTRRGAGRPPLDPATRVLRGTWRPDRHGPQPATAAPVVYEPAAGAAGLVPPDPPGHLSAEAASWWTYVTTTWALDRHHLLLLRAASEAWDQAQQAREVLARDGLTVATADGGIKAHPCLTVATSARAQFASLVAQLDLDDAGAPAEGQQRGHHSSSPRR